MKETEAKKLICPMLSNQQIIVNTTDGYSVSSYEELSKCNCITRECMFWIREKNKEKEDIFGYCSMAKK